MAKFDKKLQALQMRKNSLSLKEIAIALQISKSTASVWCQSVSLTKEQQSRLTKRMIQAGHAGRLKGALVNKERKQRNVLTQEKIAQDMVGALTDRDRLMLGIGLYWGEGAKYSSSRVSLINSDPELVRVARDWLEMLGVSRADFSPYIFIAESHKDREKELISFWSRYLNIPRSHFHKPVFLKGRRKKVYENHNLYYGILALRVRRSATLKYRILGLIKAIKSG